MREILVIAGESSGESYGAELAREIKKLIPDVRFFGVGGEEMAKEGVELICHIEKLSIIGILEVIPHLFKLLKIKREIVIEAKKRKPVCSILIDSPDFNLRLAKELKRAGIPVIYFISPTVWAWRKGRIKKIKKHVSLLLIIFPFEKEIYEKAGVPYIFVGHPLKDRVKVDTDRERLRKDLGIENLKPVISILPGSRKTEITNHLPILVDSLKELRKNNDFKAFLIKAPGISENLIREYLNGFEIEIVENERFKKMACSDIALASCGTSNLELLLLGVPFIAFYKISRLSYLIARILVKVKHASIVNIMAGREIVPELLQSNFNKNNILKKIQFLLFSEEERERIKNEFKRIKDILGEEGAMSRSAKAIVEFLSLK
jgi:lipid-A-disaccharide synthase